MRRSDRSRSWAARAALAIAALTGMWAAFGGCRQILSIEDKEYDPSLDADAGADADAAAELSCESYCALIQSVCTGNNEQFSSVEACTGLCSTFPVGTLDDTGGNTLGCRIHVLETSKAMIESSDCAAAGPGGDGTCGTNCESYCASMKIVCPDKLAGMDCSSVCAPLLDCGTYHVEESVTPNDSTIQCRLYHISAAAVDLESAVNGAQTANQMKHCPHAAGETECVYDADAGCP